MRRAILTGVVASLLLGSSAVARPIPEIPLEEGAQAGLVYVYRGVTPKWQFGINVFELDGREVNSLSYGNCTAIRVPAGEHGVGVWGMSLYSGDFKADPVKASVRVEPGSRHYFRVTYDPSARAWSVYEVSADEARAEMDRCGYVKPKRAWESRAGGVQ